MNLLGGGGSQDTTVDEVDAFALADKKKRQHLEAMRLVGDELGDRTMEKVRRLGVGGMVALGAIMKSLTHSENSVRVKIKAKNNNFDADKVNKIIGEYLEESGKMPAWADYQKLDIAVDVFGANAPAIILILFCSSLPITYSCKNGVNVLGVTRRLASNSIAHRLLQTAQFIIDVMHPDGFKPKVHRDQSETTGIAILAIQKVRLIHAAIRTFVKAYQPDKEGHRLLGRPGWFTYDEAAMGMPINQEDLAGTMLAFSLIIIEGLEKLGIPLSDEEADAYLHSWKVIGHMLGIYDNMMPNNLEEAQSLRLSILVHQARPSFVGTTLMSELIKFMQKCIPTRLFDDMPAASMHRLLPRLIPDLLDIPTPSDWGKKAESFALKMMTLMIKLARKGNVRSNLFAKFNRFMVQLVISVYLRRHRALLAVPTHLRNR